MQQNTYPGGCSLGLARDFTFPTRDEKKETCLSLQQVPTLFIPQYATMRLFRDISHALSPWSQHLEASSGISRAGIWDDNVFASRGESFP